MTAAIGLVAGTSLTACASEEPIPARVVDNGDIDDDNGSTEDTDNTPDEPGSTDDDADDNDPEDVVIEEGDDVDDQSEEVDEQTRTDVDAFIQRYIAAENDAITSGDFSAAGAFIESCRVCDDIERYIRNVYADGGTIEGSQLTDPVITVDRRVEGQVHVTVTGTVSAYVVTNGDEAVDDGEAYEIDLGYQVAEIEGAWQIVGGSRR